MITRVDPYKAYVANGQGKKGQTKNTDKDPAKMQNHSYYWAS